MGIKSIICSSCICLAAISFNVYADILSYGGYTHDTSTNIVTGGGLEWLQWTATLGNSIDSIQPQLGTIEGGGWSIATSSQLAQLFNAFDFGYTFDPNINIPQGGGTGYTVGDDPAEADNMFISMFGDTFQAAGFSYCYGGDCITRSTAMFMPNSFPSSGPYYNKAQVQDDYIDEYGANVRGSAHWSGTYGYLSSYSNAEIGIALVRPAPAVSAPAAVWLFSSGFVGLFGFARRKK